jgi:hypothetical protein
MQVQLRIRRFNPEKDKKPWWGDYTWMTSTRPTPCWMCCTGEVGN